MKVIGVINGPNINLTGIREKDIYGSEDWESIQKMLMVWEEKQDGEIELVFYQSNIEGEIIDFIQKNIYIFDGILINPASLSGYGYGVLDALTAIEVPFVEVHMSNIFAREKWHQKSIFVEKAIGRIIGFGGYGYLLGVMALRNYLFEKKD